ncbi:hypothetical protein FT663_05416 [Candidozyma haemuli var. vulneris]|uniref:DUF2470 domain-containing protein n=1 Tax=Candidozyma haemuli TaxID=45357 RepID=A0A2V1ARM4_9ASCO|nr:hypothetical protein CXQ85_004387 [[Candida] haemuloni]KAF3985007.1 hypothetical protein FT662_05417 [[Candida] haemuloni var. vulneris]KAF3985153.1 hypothetical protein FT663_05416 [[Candida] haemuloni var. vulneris]PVH20877.1 hypothetical protein CXQ85_004387 [[Candida] haemuloni]
MSDHSKRITSHMNKDHQLALVDYVVVYGKIPVHQLEPSSVQMTAVDEKSLTLSYKRNAASEEIVLVWNELADDDKIEVNGFMDIKAKLISMAKYAARVQGYSHKQLKKVVLPNRPPQVFMYLVAIVLALGSIDKFWVRNIINNDAFLSSLTSRAPAFLKSAGSFLEDHVRTIAIAMYAIHLVEIAIVSLPKLKAYRASGPRKLAWTTMHFLEGFLIFKRLNKALEDAH